MAGLRYGLILNEGRYYQMNHNVKALVFAAAVSGLFTGTAVRANAATTAEGGHTQFATQTATDSASLILASKKKVEKHACKGQNSCKGQGADHKNSCKGKGSCAPDGSKPPMKS